MDRFFFFLKDFDLTHLEFHDKKKDLLDKTMLITLFKKISANCRDLSFEEFVILI